MALIIPYVEQSWVDGVSLASAARLTVIEDGIHNVSQAPAVRATHNTTQSLTSGVDTTLAFNTDRFDQAGGASSTMHDTVTNNSRLTCLYAGVYQITAGVRFAANATGIRQLKIRLNNTADLMIQNQNALSSGTTIMIITTLYPLAVNDFVEVVANQTSGGALNVESAANYSPEFMMVRAA